MEWWTNANMSSEHGDSQIGSGEPIASAPVSAIFDPWLTSTCDELDLGIILDHHHQAAASGSSSSDADSPQQQQQHQHQNSNNNHNHHHHHHHQNQHQLHRQSQQGGDTVAGQMISFGADAQKQCHASKRNLSNILNNSSKHNCSASSTAASPASSSMGASPVGHGCVLLSAGYSAQQQHQQQHQQLQQQHSQAPLQQQQQRQHDYDQKVFALPSQRTNDCDDDDDDDDDDDEDTNHKLNSIGSCIVSAIEQSQPVHSSSAACTSDGYQHTNGHSMIAASSSSNKSSAAYFSMGSSLLNTVSRPTSQPITRLTVSNKSRGQQRAAGSVSEPTQQKTRRCRHITDFVLADEERRLLIKEGHTDFPMSCHSRPLSKSEERILRKIRRKIRNKKSAQCSRQRKKEYVEDLERKYAAIVRENEELRKLAARLQLAQSQHCNDITTATEIDHQFRQHNQISHTSSTSIISASNGADQSRQPAGNSPVARAQQQQSPTNELIDWKDLFPHPVTTSAAGQLAQSSSAHSIIY